MLNYEISMKPIVIILSLLILASCSRGVEPVNVEPTIIIDKPKITLPEPQMPAFRELNVQITDGNVCMDSENYKVWVHNNTETLRYVRELKTTKAAVQQYYEGD